MTTGAGAGAGAVEGVASFAGSLRSPACPSASDEIVEVTAKATSAVQALDTLRRPGATRRPPRACASRPPLNALFVLGVIRFGRADPNTVPMRVGASIFPW